MVQCIHVVKRKKAGSEEKLRRLVWFDLEMTQWLRAWALLLWRSGVGFTAPTLGPSKLPVTPGNRTPSSGLRGNIHWYADTHIQSYTIHNTNNLKIMKVNL